MKCAFYLTLATLLASIQFEARADGAPEPYDKNHSGVLVGGGAVFGHSRATGGAKESGTGWLVNAKGGYIAADQSWNRVEFAFEGGHGMATFKDKNKAKVDLALDFVGLATFGYGYSIGNQIFGVMRGGLGPVFASYSTKGLNGSQDSESTTGWAALLGYDVVFAGHDTVGFVAGLDYRIMSLSGDHFDSFQLHLMGVNVGVRIVL